MDTVDLPSSGLETRAFVSLAAKVQLIPLILTLRAAGWVLGSCVRCLLARKWQSASVSLCLPPASPNALGERACFCVALPSSCAEPAQPCSNSFLPGSVSSKQARLALFGRPSRSHAPSDSLDPVAGGSPRALALIPAIRSYQIPSSALSLWPLNLLPPPPAPSRPVASVPDI